MKMKNSSGLDCVPADDTSTVASGQLTPEDVSTIASDLLTPVVEPSERSHTDGIQPDLSDSWATEPPTPEDSESEASKSGPSPPMNQPCSCPRNRRQASARRRQSRNRNPSFNLFSVFTLAAVLSVAAISWWIQSRGSSFMQPRVNPIDEFIASQDDWIAINDIITEYDYLPEEIKSRETTMTDLMLAVKHSNLPRRHRLAGEMQKFSVIADRVVDDLIDWTSLAAATVDRIQNMNYHALLGYQSLQRMGSWTAIPAPAAEDVGLIPTLQHFGHVVSAAIVGDRRQKSITLHQLFVQDADKAGSQLKLLKVRGTSLAKDFRKMSNHLERIADISRSEEAQLKSEERQRKSRVRGRMGLNSCAIRELKTQAEELHVMAQRMMEGREMMKGATIKIRKLDKGFGKLYLALAEGKWEEVDAIPWRLASIQAAVNRLEGVRESTRPRVAKSQQQVV
ncbi:hypothetical protein EDB81DRAFT_905601 [Dactylonectria macrodidyma]|uniref:Uncharacterized protein n=1 Tax=Dactylonectria macrodidyma TaxID=307937 RepID=A0A9P9IQ37_9HYPO|nr:hypothetical protein EDB81DRAFT_905601 [Dactylonectria macrodidyma]